MKRPLVATAAVGAPSIVLLLCTSECGTSSPGGKTSTIDAGPVTVDSQVHEDVCSPQLSSTTFCAPASNNGPCPCAWTVVLPCVSPGAPVDGGLGGWGTCSDLCLEQAPSGLGCPLDLDVSCQLSTSEGGAPFVATCRLGDN